MNKQDYITKATLTDKQREFRAEYRNKYHSTRRKLNAVGGLVCGVITYKALPYLNIDISQPLTDTDVLKVCVMYGALLFAWRLFRQQIQGKNTPADYYDEEVKQAIDKLTPQQAVQLLKEDNERMTAYKTDKTRANGTACVLMVLLVIGTYLFFKGVF